jgi:FlaA1/EpsC-like NDP-sugar epimerase
MEGENESNVKKMFRGEGVIVKGGKGLLGKMMIEKILS